MFTISYEVHPTCVARGLRSEIVISVRVYRIDPVRVVDVYKATIA